MIRDLGEEQHDQEDDHRDVPDGEGRAHLAPRREVVGDLVAPAHQVHEDEQRRQHRRQLRRGAVHARHAVDGEAVGERDDVDEPGDHGRVDHGRERAEPKAPESRPVVGQGL